jgi:glycosyltransferase involved in cell wall biosynthesis
VQTDRLPQSLPGKDLLIPKISLGMPVFNGEKSIREALDSLLTQTFTDFELIISDNASTDGTEAICREYVDKDSRIRYVRQAENRGAGANFWFVLDEAQGEYFMWAACDDIRSRDFLKINYEFISQNPDYIASTSPVRFANGDFHPVKMGDRSLDGPKEDRVVEFFECWHANGRFYSLFRRKALLSVTTLRSANYLALDWAIVLELLCIGKFKRCANGEVILGVRGISHSLSMYKIYRKGLFSWIFPLGKFIVFVIRLSRNFNIYNRIIILLKLIKLNYDGVVSQLQYEKRLILNSEVDSDFNFKPNNSK